MTRLLFAADRGDGPQTIVLLHGFGSSHAVWNGIVPALARLACVLAYDLPGHGGSHAFPDAGPAKLAARTVLSDLSGRGVGRVHVVGHSMGGAVAVLMALSEPERVESLTLLAPGGFGEAINGPLLRRYARAADERELRACLLAMSGPGAELNDPDIAASLTMRGRPGQIERLAAIADLITRGDRQGVLPRNRIAALEMPATILWGTDDPVLPATQADGLPARFEVHRVAGAGHMLIAEAPGRVVEAIADTVARSPG